MKHAMHMASFEQLGCCVAVVVCSGCLLRLGLLAILSRQMETNDVHLIVRQVHKHGSPLLDLFMQVQVLVSLLNDVRVLVPVHIEPRTAAGVPSVATQHPAGGCSGVDGEREAELLQKCCIRLMLEKTILPDTIYKVRHYLHAALFACQQLAKVLVESSC